MTRAMHEGAGRRRRAIRATRSTSSRSRSSRWRDGHLARRRAVRVGAARGALRRAEPRAFEGVLDMLSGRYPSDEFAELRPRVTWDRVQGTITGRDGRQARGDRQRGNDSRSRALRRLPRRAPISRRASASSMKRWSSNRGRRNVPARRLDVADRGDHPRPRARLAGAGRAGQDAVLAGRSSRTPGRAGPGDRQAGSRSARASARPQSIG